MNSRGRNRILFAALASMTTVLLLACPAGVAAEGPPVYKREMGVELLSAFAALGRGMVSLVGNKN